MDINVESNFEGKNLPRLTSFISNQIRRSVKKKHTMPRYKVRYKPFFIQEKPQDGKHEVKIKQTVLFFAMQMYLVTRICKKIVDKVVWLIAVPNIFTM